MELIESIKFFSDNSNTVRELYEDNQCCWCGACILVCPKDAISYSLKEVIVNDNCISCGRCLQICPQNQKLRYVSKMIEKMDNSSLAEFKPKLKHVPIGSFENIYISKAAKKEVFESSMVGGTTLSLLLYALESSVIDAIIVADFDSRSPFPSGKIVTTTKELLDSGGSKYLPTMSLEKLTEVIRDEKMQSIAITALPCQAYAIRKFGSDPKTAVLASKIKLVLAIFCGTGLPSKADIEQYLIQRKIEEKLSNFKVTKKKVKRFWRLNPQDQQRYIFSTQSGKNYDFSSRRILKTKSKENCRTLCPDYTGYFADISIGAATMNSTITVTRTEIGEHFFQEALKEGYIELKRFNSINYFLINLMGKKKREKNHLAYEKLF